MNQVTYSWSEQLRLTRSLVLPSLPVLVAQVTTPSTNVTGISSEVYVIAVSVYILIGHHEDQLMRGKDSTIAWVLRTVAAS